MYRKQGKFMLFDLPAFADWLRDFSPRRRVWRVQNHHTFSPSYDDFNGSNHFAKLTGMEDYHVNTNHWSEIAQNLTTFPDGTVAVCRSFDKTPAGIVGANGGALCIENLGNFDLGGDAMTDEQRATILKLNALLCRKYLLTPTTNSIVYHHWFAAKS
ncbi:MAG TPA: N-acetylmuramoyl-L-alanine amidase, partial [bacterium]|nr:N-acetylmuramoyl-L-alanine amidase [bacterium]